MRIQDTKGRYYILNAGRITEEGERGLAWPHYVYVDALVLPRVRVLYLSMFSGQERTAFFVRVVRKNWPIFPSIQIGCRKFRGKNARAIFEAMGWD